MYSIRDSRIDACALCVHSLGVFSQNWNKNTLPVLVVWRRKLYLQLLPYKSMEGKAENRKGMQKKIQFSLFSLLPSPPPPPPSLPLWLISGGLFHHTTYVYVYTLLTDITVCLLLLSHSDYNHFRFDDNLKRTRVFGLYKGMAVGTSVGMVYFLIFLIYSVSFW